MAYQKAFNPDALPAHAEPDQAAQAMGSLQANRRPLPSNRPGSHSPLNPPSNRPASPSAAHRLSPVNVNPPPQSSYRPTAGQTNQNYQNYQYSNNASGAGQRLQSPPPPAGYGHGPRPQGDAAVRNSSPNAPLYQYPARTPAPPEPDSEDVYSLFRAANASRTGYLTASELGSALVNADFTPFDSLTISSLIRMFSTSPPHQPQGPTITFGEFENLWRFLAAWRELFERFDEDSSGRISLGEFSKALVAFGYRLSQSFVGVLYNTFNDRGKRLADARRGSRDQILARGMSFDLFVQACISLKRMTDVFKGYDDDRDGFITLSFEEFLSEILRLRE